MEPIIKRGSADNDIWELNYIHQWGSSATQGSFMEHLDSSRIWSKWHNAKHIIIYYQIIYDPVYSSSILSYIIIYYPVYSHECLKMTQYGFSNDAKKKSILSIIVNDNYHKLHINDHILCSRFPKWWIYQWHKKRNIRAATKIHQNSAMFYAIFDGVLPSCDSTWFNMIQHDLTWFNIAV